MPVSQCNFESIQEKQGADGQSHTINCLLSRWRSTKDIPSPFLPLKHPVHFAATNTGSFLEMQRDLLQARNTGVLQNTNFFNPSHPARWEAAGWEFNLRNRNVDRNQQNWSFCAAVTFPSMFSAVCTWNHTRYNFPVLQCVLYIHVSCCHILYNCSFDLVSTLIQHTT